MSAHALLRLRPAALPPWRRDAADAVVHERPERRPAARRDDRRELPQGRRALRRPRGARRPPSGLPRDLQRALGAGRPGGARVHGDGRRQGRPHRHLGAEPLRVGRDAVRRRPHRRHPRHDQPGLQVGRARLRAREGRRERPRHGPRLPRRELPAHGRRRLRRLPRAARGRRARARLGGLPDRGPAHERRGAGRARGEPPVRRPDQHPVHVGHHGLAQGRDADAPQPGQQRALHGDAPGLQLARPRLRPGAVLPHLRHGARDARLRLARRVHRCTERVVRPRRRARDDRGRELYLAATACRRCSSPSSRIPPSSASISPACARG